MNFRSSQLGIITYIITYALLYEKGYQEWSGVESSVITKVNCRKKIYYHDDIFTVNFDIDVPYNVYRFLWRRRKLDKYLGGGDLRFEMRN